MPDLILLVSPDASQFISSHMGELGPRLRQATADALGNKPEQVEVMKFDFTGGDNAMDMQILAIGSTSPERRKKLKAWAIALATAWADFAEEMDLSWGKNVDVWPILPEGYWMMATRDAIQKAEDG